MKKLYLLLLILKMMMPSIQAAEYIIDQKGMHASIQFKISHLGYSWLWGRFNTFNGSLSYDKDNAAASKITVSIDTASIDSNHALRDKHLRGEDFLDVKTYPEAHFISSSFQQAADGSGVLQGKFTLKGITRDISINVQKIGEGKDPWGGYRVGFEGVTRIALTDYDITTYLGPASKQLDLIFSFEAIRK